ncbi:hypothetical protein FEM48_Zijuj01G0236400 [Ziziphus jujuba var. spinosa]|uniref:Glycosyltransferase 61 catalytic domain-containing protein n=1 Tax=Ziziphus jujuba var. spinosa TaxID=714518 RepID=A0A978W484_ZIZJJ|nr:hypothetical protein FEM48_Zijuj01G0236400 [Ziziphus jujuba var. spinosa]
MSNVEEFSILVDSCSFIVGAHCAGLANAVLLLAWPATVQVVPVGLEWASTRYFGAPVNEMGLKYLEYKIKPEESSLLSTYGPDDPVIKDPYSIFLKGYCASRYVYLDGQDLKINVMRLICAMHSHDRANRVVENRGATSYLIIFFNFENVVSDKSGAGMGKEAKSLFLGATTKICLLAFVLLYIAFFPSDVDHIGTRNQQLAYNWSGNINNRVVDYSDIEVLQEPLNLLLFRKLVKGDSFNPHNAQREKIKFNGFDANGFLCRSDIHSEICLASEPVMVDNNATYFTNSTRSSSPCSSPFTIFNPMYSFYQILSIPGSFLKESYNVKAYKDVPTMAVKPRLLLISRNGSRSITNELELKKLMEEVGIQVIVAEPKTTSNLAKFAGLVNSCRVMVGVHGAGLTNQVFLPDGTMMMQLVPLGLDWAATNCYGEPATKMGNLSSSIQSSWRLINSFNLKNNVKLVTQDSISIRLFPIGKQRLSNWNDGNQNSIVDKGIEEIDGQKFLLRRLVRGEDRIRLDSTGFSCNSDFHSEVCIADKPVIVDNNEQTIYVPSTETQAKRMVQPYALKDDPTAMKYVTPVKILHGNTHLPSCDFNHNVPAVVFSSGGFTGNIFHELNELIIPLFITCRHFGSNVRFVITDFKPWWVSKYNRILSRLSRFEVLNPAENGTAHCFPGAIVGLKYHDNLALNYSEIPGGYSMFDFKHFLRETYDLKHRDVPNTEKPVLILISRPNSRRFLNEREMKEMMKELGFQIIVATPNRMSNLDKFASLVNSCSVMVGAHGAGLANSVFLPSGAVMVQVVPLGLEWASTNYFGGPATEMEVKYLEYKITAEESSLSSTYGPDDPVIKDPESIFLKGYHVARDVYVHGQNLQINVTRFRETLVEAMKLLGRYEPLK